MAQPTGFQVSHVMKIESISSVNLPGKLDFLPNDPGDMDLGSDWFIVDYDGTRRRLEDWLEKFEGKRVNITISTYVGKDDAPMLEGLGD